MSYSYWVINIQVLNLFGETGLSGIDPSWASHLTSHNLDILDIKDIQCTKFCTYECIVTKTLWKGPMIDYGSLFICFHTTYVGHNVEHLVQRDSSFHRVVTT